MGKNETCSWDDGKREIVFIQRGIDFGDLAPFFRDDYALILQDMRKDYGEARYNMIASYRDVILNITFTPRHDYFHIISARMAHRKERKHYVEGKAQSEQPDGLE